MGSSVIAAMVGSRPWRWKAAWKRSIAASVASPLMLSTGPAMIRSFRCGLLPGACLPARSRRGLEYTTPVRLRKGHDAVCCGGTGPVSHPRFAGEAAMSANAPQVECRLCATLYPDTLRFCPNCSEPSPQVHEDLLMAARLTGVSYEILLQRAWAEEGLVRLRRPPAPLAAR